MSEPGGGGSYGGGGKGRVDPQQSVGANNLFQSRKRFSDIVGPLGKAERQNIKIVAPLVVLYVLLVAKSTFGHRTERRTLHFFPIRFSSMKPLCTPVFLGAATARYNRINRTERPRLSCKKTVGAHVRSMALQLPCVSGEGSTSVSRSRRQEVAMPIAGRCGTASCLVLPMGRMADGSGGCCLQQCNAQV